MTQLILALAVATFAITANAQDKQIGERRPADAEEIAPNEGSDSCGLGWKITQERTLMATTTRGTVNFFVPPSFGMSTGSLGCEKHGFALKEANAASYAAANFEPLKGDLAKGKGEYLEAFAFAMGCLDTSALGSSVRAHFREILPAAGGNGHDLYRNVRGVIRSEKKLAALCPNAA